MITQVSKTTAVYLHPTVVVCVELEEVVSLQNRVHELREAHSFLTLTALLHTGDLVGGCGEEVGGVLHENV